MKKHCYIKQNREKVSSNHFVNWIGYNTLFWGLASLIWLLINSGRKPSRIQYPCQKAAAANVSIFLLPLFIPIAYKVYPFLKTSRLQQMIRFLIMAVVSIGLLLSSGHLWIKYQHRKQIKTYNQLQSSGPFGKKIINSLGITTGLLTVPHAMAMPSPHRVVSVHHSGATSWDFQCTGEGPCLSYYGDSSYVDQNVVNQMFDRGMLKLTDTNSIQDAWKVILPNYKVGEIVAIKVNFNGSITGGGVSGYADNDAYVDALPQVVNSVIFGLKSRGVAEEDILVFDSSRYITDRFRSLIVYSNVRYYDLNGNGDDVNGSTFSSGIASANVDFSNSGYPVLSSAHKISDILINSDYLINIPIMKKHVGAGITLSLKNHLGSINGLSDGTHPIHNYFYFDGGNYDFDTNPIVDINNNTHIKDKTVLIVGDALYAGWSSNNTPPERWDSFNNDSPNMLFFAVDPVAVDSVMFDYIDREGYVHSSSKDIMIVAANTGLGVHERWNNDTDREYTSIDYIEIDLKEKDQSTPQQAINLLLLTRQ